MRTLSVVLSCLVLSSTASLAANHVPFGKPADGFPIEHPGYVAGYKSSLRSPLWVAYHLKPEYCSGPKRIVYSKPPIVQDPIVLEKGLNSASPDDFEQSGYWPLPLISHNDSLGRDAQCEKDSFSLAVMVAQTQSRDTRKLWKDLEELVRKAVAEYGELWIITGPAFAEEPVTTSRGKVGVPEAFYKIAARKDEAGKVWAVAWLIPQNAVGEPDNYITTVDEVEKATRLDFLSDISNEIQNELEAKMGTSFGEVKPPPSKTKANLPPDVITADNAPAVKKPEEVLPEGPVAVPSNPSDVWVFMKKSFFYLSGSPMYGRGEGRFMPVEEAEGLGFVDKSSTTAAQPAAE